MKTLIITAIFTLSAALSFASNGDDKINAGVFVFDNAEVIYEMSEPSQESFINTMEYDSESQEFFISTTEMVRFIQLVDNSDELVYQIPVGNKKIYLSLKELNSGSYKLNMLLDGSESMIESKVTKK